MNPETGRDDVMSLAPHTGVVYDEPLRLSEVRSDLAFYPVPFDQLVAPVCPNARLRRLVRNMIYVGVLVELLDIDMAEAEKALNKQLGSKPKALSSTGTPSAPGWNTLGSISLSTSVAAWRA